MKQILIALMVALTLCSLANAQHVAIHNDSIKNVKVTISKAQTGTGNAASTAVTVVGTATIDADSTDIDSVYNQGSNHASFSFDTDDDGFPFSIFGNQMGAALLIPIIAIISVFGLPVFILFLIFFFRYKNRKARYRLAEQAIAAGQPLPEGFIKENLPTDSRSAGIKNTFTGVGLFIFLWGITGEFGIGAIGLLVMFMGIGQWLIGYQQEKKNNETKVDNSQTKEHE